MDNMTMPPVNLTLDESVLPNIKIAIIVLYVGVSLSIFSTFVALITYITSRFLRVKRPHIITINLCISLLIFYIGYVMAISNFADIVNTGRFRCDAKEYDFKPSMLCKASAFLIFSGWFFMLSWLLVHWFYLCYTIQKRVSPYISNFLIKSCVPAYGISLLLSVIFSLVEEFTEDVFIDPEQCTYTSHARSIDAIFILFSFAWFALIFGCVIYSLLRLICYKDEAIIPSKIKKSTKALVRLGALTLIIVLCQIPHFVLWHVHDNRCDAEYIVRLEVADGVLTGLQGILIVICLIFRSDEIRLYLHSVFFARDIDRSISIKASSQASVRRISRVTHSPKISTLDDSNMDRSCTKIEPRESDCFELTVEDEVFLSSPKPKLRSPEKIVQEERRDTTSSGTSKISMSMRRKVLNASIRKSNKSSVSSTSSITYSPTKTPSPLQQYTNALTLNRFNFRDSRISMAGEHDRKSSF